MKDAGQIQDDHLYLVNGENHYVSFGEEQNLTEAQQALARNNIDAVSTAELAIQVDNINTTITNSNTTLQSSINQTKTDLEIKFANADNITSGILDANRLATSGVTAGTYGQSSDKNLSHGDTFDIPYITIDNKGRVTSASSNTITLPSSIDAANVNSGTLASEMKVANNANWNEAMLRNVYAGTADLVAGQTQLTSGVIYLVYE